jgi:outer membrane autotransporter protein
MNNIYKSKWNESTRTWVACSELVRGKCKSNGLKIVAAVALALASTSAVADDALPPDEEICPTLDCTKVVKRQPTRNNFIHSDGATSGSKVDLRFLGRSHHKASGEIVQDESEDFNILIQDHFILEGKIRNTTNSDNAGNLIIRNNHGEIKTGGITNEGAGNITILNQFLIASEIASTENSTGNIIIENKKDLPLSDHRDPDWRDRAITGKIINQGSGTFEINNTSRLTGEISNTGNGKIILDNNGTSTGDIINSGSALSLIEVTNRAGIELGSTVSNTQAGNIKLTNQGTITKDITNSGAGTITLNNSGTSSSKIENTGDGRITLDNSGTSTGDIINSGSASSQIEITNRAGIDLGSTVSNTQAGNIKLTNQGTITKDITNSGAGAITLNNSGTSSSKIENTGDGRITLDNSGTSTGDIINSGSASSQIEVINNAGIELGSTVSNTQAGNIKLTNQGTITKDITNSGAGTIILNNSGTSSSKIENTGDGKITLDNSGTSTGDIINSGSASSQIEVTNRAGIELGSTVSNTQAGNIKLTNQGTITKNITNSDAGTIILNNSGTSSSKIENTGDGRITLDNSGTSTGNIINSGSASSQIEVNNKADTELGSTVSNTRSGNIKLTNQGTITGDITNSGQLGSLISVTNNNGAILNGNISNTGAGTIALNNSGKSTGNIINDSDSKESQINVTNNAGATLDSTISNTKAGTIELTNKGTATGNITNSGSKNSLIQIINNTGATLSSNVSNTGAGTIKLNNEATFNGNLINTNSGTITAINTGIFTGTTNNSNANGKINLDNQGKWIITGSSSLSQLTNTGSIIFPRIAEANVRDKNQYNTINIKEYKGTGGSIYVNTYWDNDGTSYADSIFIEKVTEPGTTRVHAMGGDEKKIIGNAQSSEVENTVNIINVQSNEPGHKFEGTADISNGAKQAQLLEIKTESGGTAYVWSLTTQDPAEPIQPTPPKEVPIYAEPVSGYVQMPTVNMELGFTTIGTLHERRGENQTYNITGTNNTALANNQQQTWGRVLVKHLDKNGKQRLDTVGNQSVLQIGHDFILDENNKTGTRRHIGAYVSYGHNENDFRDQYRAENGYVVDDHYTGKGRTDAVSVGGYSTFYGNNGGYVDLVGQVSYLRNKYNARSNESVHQNGWGAALSVETGKSFTVYGNNWFVEPQAQLVYQYLSLDDFNDGIRHIDQHNPSALRGRVGMRFGYNGATTDNLPPSSFYGIANIWHDFVNPKSVDIGRDTLKEEYAKTWGEVGVGIQLPITRQSDFYSDVRYEKNFGSTKRKGFKGTIGYKYTWL